MVTSINFIQKYARNSWKIEKKMQGYRKLNESVNIASSKWIYMESLATKIIWPCHVCVQEKDQSTPKSDWTPDRWDIIKEYMKNSGS